MATVLPGDISTQPNTKVVYNAPFSATGHFCAKTINLRVQNNGVRRIGWAVKTTSMHRLNVDPPAGVLDVGESVLLAVSCIAFNFASEDTNNDRISLEWVNAPEGGTVWRSEWFCGDGMVRQKNLRIEYKS